jgi:N-acetylmuramoyl-L-alanine amidase
LLAFRESATPAGAVAAASGLIVAILLLSVVPAHGAPAITAIRHWTAPDQTRIVVDLTEQAEFSARILTKPDRAVILIVGGKIGDARRNTPIADGLAERVRLNQLRSGAQVVVDLTKTSAFNVFSLKPYMEKPFRVVIDVARDEPKLLRPPSTEIVEPWRDPAPRVVVIDPGHGGEDPGTLGNGKLKEKHVVLDIAKKLAAILNERGGYETLLTRDGDYFVRLAKRKKLASESEGDIFISIHGNSAPNGNASGTEIFFVSPRGATDQAARELADRENAADLVGGVSPDADEDVLSILVDLKMSDSVHKSGDLASLVANELVTSKTSTSVVKQAGFVVLKSLAMPSILVEVGFLTNRGDVQKLSGDDYRRTYATCLADAVDSYFDRYAPVVAQNGFHKVAPGETLWSIARRYNLSVEELRGFNNLTEDARVHVDQLLTVKRS